MREILVPRHKTVQMPHLGVKGRFYVDLIDAKTGIIKRHLEFDNLITNEGLDAWQSGSFTMANLFGQSFGNNIYYMGVGTDSTAPTATDTTLGAEISPTTTHRTNGNGGATPGTYAYVSGPPDYGRRTMTWVFAEAQGNGNLTEIGLFTANSGGVMWTRQLFKDSGGTPTTVVKTASEQLRVTYELRIQPPQSDVTGTVTIDGVSYDYTVRGLDVDAGTFGWAAFLGTDNLVRSSSAHHASAYETQTLSARTAGGPGGSASPCSSCTIASYTGGTYYRDYTAIWQPGAGNFGLGIGAVSFLSVVNVGGHNPTYQISFAATSGGARIPKDDTKRLTLVFRHTIGRV